MYGKRRVKWNDNKVKVIINEQHKLLPEQEMLINKEFGKDGWEFLLVPAKGWDVKETEEVADSILKINDTVFVSPVPLLLAIACIRLNHTYLFFNPNREKKELPNGKVIFTVPAKGWELLYI